MKRALFIGCILAGSVLAPAAHAQRFPYRSAVFFHDCAHLAEARHNEPNEDLVNDISCARYIEGYEMGYLTAKNLPETCLADPLSLFTAATADYRQAPQPDELPTKFLAEAILAHCNH